jgi:hypothetical protein
VIRRRKKKKKKREGKGKGKRCRGWRGWSREVHLIQRLREERQIL